MTLAFTAPMSRMSQRPWASVSSHERTVAAGRGGRQDRAERRQRAWLPSVCARLLCRQVHSRHAQLSPETTKWPRTTTTPAAKCRASTGPASQGHHEEWQGAGGAPLLLRAAPAWLSPFSGCAAASCSTGCLPPRRCMPAAGRPAAQVASVGDPTRTAASRLAEPARRRSVREALLPPCPAVLGCCCCGVAVLGGAMKASPRASARVMARTVHCNKLHSSVQAATVLRRELRGERGRPSQSLLYSRGALPRAERTTVASCGRTLTGS